MSAKATVWSRQHTSWHRKATHWLTATVVHLRRFTCHATSCHLSERGENSRHLHRSLVLVHRHDQRPVVLCTSHGRMATYDVTSGPPSVNLSMQHTGWHREAADWLAGRWKRQAPASQSRSRPPPRSWPWRAHTSFSKCVRKILKHMYKTSFSNIYVKNVCIHSKHICRTSF